MSQITNFKCFDLEERTLRFARQARVLVKSLPKSINNFEDGKQLVRSSGSVGANYIEANESLSKKDFIMRVKIAKKEAKETRFWLQLVEIGDDQELGKSRGRLIDESLELMKIFGAIIEKTK
ncbi:MAG: four helix bundle protein [Patescibacteria group bacterium]|jgi:four helix bundle protein